MAPEAYIQQSSQGWLRNAIPAMRGNAGYFAQRERRLAAAPDIIDLESIPARGCLLLDHATEPESVCRYAAQQGLFCLPQPAGETADAPVSRTRHESSSQDPTKAPGPKPWKHAATLGFAGMGLYTASQGRYLGSAAENLCNAYQAPTKELDGWAVTLAAAGIYAMFQGNFVAPALTSLFYAVSATQVAGDDTNEPAG